MQKAHWRCSVYPHFEAVHNADGFLSLVTPTRNLVSKVLSTRLWGVNPAPELRVGICLLLATLFKAMDKTVLVILLGSSCYVKFIVHALLIEAF